MQKLRDAHGLLSAMLAILMAGALQACGGGGGSGGGSNGTSTGSAAPVSAVLKSSAVLHDIIYEGLPPHQKLLEFTLEGNLGALSQRTLYIVLEDPAGVYGAPVPFMESDGTSFTLSLYGTSTYRPAPGRQTGSFRIHACLDRSCTSRLQNSPVELDYDIEVRQGIALSRDSLEITADFGTAPTAAQMTVTVPAGASQWSATPLRSIDGASSSSHALVPFWLHRSGDTLSLQPPDNVLPGVYAVEYQVDTVVADPVFPQTPQRLVRTFTVGYKVIATGVYSMSPASESLQAAGLNALSPPAISTIAPTLVSQVGGTFSRRGVRTDDAYPAAAIGDPLLATWLSFYDGEADISRPSHAIKACDLATGRCLPVGVYSGALLLRHTARDGTQTDFEFPVSLQVDP